MNKIKVTKNDKVIAFDFTTNLLEKDKMYKLCEIFKLDEIYMDIYGANQNFTTTLLERNAYIMHAKIDNSYGIAIKANSKDILEIADVLSEFDFDDINIWDCYTTWDNYLHDKNTKMPFFAIKPFKVENDSNFYLNYNPAEGNKVEIICELAYDSQELTTRLNDLLK